VLVPFCDRLLRGTRVSPQAWAGSILAVIGTILLVGGFQARPSLGDLMTAPLGLAAVQVLAVGAAALVPSLFAPRMPVTPKVAAVVLFTAVVTTALAFVAMMWGQARVSATEAAVILAFEPVAAAVTSIVFYGEPVTALFIAGGLLILGGMLVSQLERRPSQRSATIRPE
jgi:drug/metabolite transporter (DMT)-like permease